MTERLHEPWLVAVWPGMGGVALIAGTALVQELGAEKVAELPSREYFDLSKIEVQHGVARPGSLPESAFHAWRNPGGGRDLLIFVGEAQPSSRGYAFCEELLATAREFGVTQVVTFAAMATPSSPQADPRVFAVATDPALLGEALAQEGVEVLEEGEISGLNGVLLAAAAAHGLSGLCLLGEFPYFASAVPNPKASSAVLRVFRALSGIDLDLSRLDAQGKAVERRLVQLLQQLQAQSGGATEQAEPGFTLPAEEAEEEQEEEEEPGLTPEARARVESLFRVASEDRSRALELKAELDRLGVFKEYEDRFLDLFKRGE